MLMLRPVISYVLTSLILCSQVGLPMHMHYCKGILESVSVLFDAKCKKHEMPVDMAACCKKALANHCSKDSKKKCCDDEVLVLKQNITSTSPSIVKWIDIPVAIESGKPTEVRQSVNPAPVFHVSLTSDSGPPIYLRHHALIFYA